MQVATRLLCVNNDSDINQVREWMEEHLKVAKTLPLDHPVLHEAAQQRPYRGAGLILWIAWNDERWRSLFNDPAYVDRYGNRVWQRLNIVHPGIEASRRPGDPDFIEVRHHIYLSYASQEQIAEYFEWFGTQISPPVSAKILASVMEKNKDILINRRIHLKAAFTTANDSANRILEALLVSTELHVFLVACLPTLENSLLQLLSYSDNRFRLQLIETIKTF